jgi:hypothetical protein
LLGREVTSFYHFVLIHSKPFDETDKDFIAQHMYTYTRLRTSRRGMGFDMPFICNTHVFEFILDAPTPMVSKVKLLSQRTFWEYLFEILSMNSFWDVL